MGISSNNLQNSSVFSASTSPKRLDNDDQYYQGLSSNKSTSLPSDRRRSSRRRSSTERRRSSERPLSDVPKSDLPKDPTDERWKNITHLHHSVCLFNKYHPQNVDLSAVHCVADMINVFEWKMQISRRKKPPRFLCLAHLRLHFRVKSRFICPSLSTGTRSQECPLQRVKARTTLMTTERYWGRPPRDEG